MHKTFLGLDIGGANTKIVAVNQGTGSLKVISDNTYYFPFWEKKAVLREFLQEKNLLLPDSHTGVGVTMTAELSDCFDTKAEGVDYIVRAVKDTFPRAMFYSVSGQFVEGKTAIAKWQEISASNWHAAASLAGKKFPNCLFIDMGSTTTDIIPVKRGNPSSRGKDDVNRLIHGELVYTGALRTNLIALTGMERFPFDGETTRGSPEYFACTADIYRVLGFIEEKDYTIDTPDGRGTSKDECLSRIAKFVCGDRELLGETGLIELCNYLMARQVDVIAEGIEEVLKAQGMNKKTVIAITGCGSFLVEKAAEKSGLENCIKLTGNHAGVDTETAFSPALAMAVLSSGLENNDTD